MFKFWGSQEQQAQPRPQDGSPQSWYPPSVVSPSSSRPSTSSLSSSGSFNPTRPAERPQSPSHVSPAEAAGIIALLKDKKIRDELQMETLQLARENLEKEPRIMELKNQSRIIRTTELAAAQEKLHELEKQKEELLKFYSPGSLLHRLQEAMDKTEEESEMLHAQLLNKEIDTSAFVQKYKKLRTTYHRRALVHLAAKTSSFG